MKGQIAFSLAVGIVIVSIPLFAHHGSSAYDSKNLVSLKGTVTEWFWANPHCILEFDVKNEKGQAVHWAVETSSPAEMITHGWSKFSLKSGEQVTVTLEPAKNGRPMGRALGVVLPNGRTLSGGFAAADASKSDDAPKK